MASQPLPNIRHADRNQDDLRGPLSNNFKLDWVGKRGAIILDHLLFAASTSNCYDFRFLERDPCRSSKQEPILGHPVGNLAKQKTKEDNAKPN